MRIHAFQRYDSSLRAGASRQGGMTMIEVLISLLVLAIGLLGFAGLQARSLQFNHSAYMRTVANNLAYDIADRMRANRVDALAGNYEIEYDDPPPSGGDVAATDLRTWLTAIDDSLPQGDGQVQLNASTLVISIRWDDTRGEGDLTEFQVTTQI